MGLTEALLMRAFGRPEGLLGSIGGRLMVRGKAGCGRWLVDELALEQEASILEIGCGPGVVLGLLAAAVPRGRVVGLDPSSTMLRQARRRNHEWIKRGVIELLQGEAESLAVEDASFDYVVALNSVQVWRDAEAGLRECRRALRPSGLLCIGFTPEAGQAPANLHPLLREAGFGNIETKHGVGATWALAHTS